MRFDVSSAAWRVRLRMPRLLKQRRCLDKALLGDKTGRSNKRHLLGQLKRSSNSFGITSF